MKIIRLAAGTMLALALGGCVTTDADYRAMDEARCRAFGFRAPSDAFSNCLLQLDLDRAAERRHRFDRFDASFGGPPWAYGRRW
ncbi:hypothetical protein [Bosea sp. (in: a-proteobacteria)]|uniref:hypothetical protein n=1 Tax=Bosea sp. (in: a-proteobacteria) TaxID=1871050 RepID=UPI0026286FD2|nr:hypothetical protein [Bosea sp. (in: a-proteobacteria)]MCO5093295.1 hypothetical protein [Bosea sp. (in: a-proteobacteria)]